MPLRLETVSPAGVIGGAPGHFVWRSASPDEPVTLVLLDAGYVELARVPGMVGCRGDVPDDVTRRLQEAATFHWFVEAAAAAGVVRSALQTCEIR